MEEANSVYVSLEELLNSIEKCNICCTGNCESFHCPLCPTTKFKPTKLIKVKKHLEGRHHWKTRVEASNGLFSVLCLLQHEDMRKHGSHFHCPICGTIFYRKRDIKNHAKKHNNNPIHPTIDGPPNSDIPDPDYHATATHNDSDPDIQDHDYYSTNTQNDSNPDITDHDYYRTNTQNDSNPDITDHDYYRTNTQNDSNSYTPDQDYQKTANTDDSSTTLYTSRPTVNTNKKNERKICPTCGRMFNKRWLKKHMQAHIKKSKDINECRHFHTVIVSPREGIYCSSINLRGPMAPIHLQKKTSGSFSYNFCENKSCIELKNAARLGNNMSFECDHVRSIPYACQGRVLDLDAESVQELRKENIILESRIEDVLSLKRQAALHDTPLCVYITGDEMASQRFIYFSVFTGKVRYWGRIKRTVVTYDTLYNTIRCKCERKRRYCIHKVVGKCVIYIKMPHIIQNRAEPLSFEEEEACDSQPVDVETELSQGDEESPITDRDIQKTIEYIRSTKMIPEDVPKDIEKIYHNQYFHDNKTLFPSEQSCMHCMGELVIRTVSKKSKIILMDQIIKDVIVCCKQCKSCGFKFRYQEWESGIHNYNNSLLVGIEIFLHIRAGIKNHVAIGRTLEIIRDVLGEEFNVPEMQKAYLHFEAMTDHSYNYNCVLCGYHPSVLIYDGFRKGGFRFSVSDVAVPSEGEENEMVNVTKFWQRVENSIIASAVDKDSSQLYEIRPSYTDWSPWIGEKSRIGNMVYNTEFKKCSKKNSEEINEPMPEELLIRLLQDEKVTSVRRICREVGVKPEGSAMDMILRLREKSISRTSFDKAYEKIYGCSGGWAVGCCHHGVVYCIKSLLRCEGARDYVDIERSLKHRPNISICDIAHLIARNGNATVENFFSPNAGRLAECTEDNITSAELGQHVFTFPYLIEPSNNYDPNDSCSNPVTGCNVHLALFDWFHEENCSKREEILRRSSLLSELAGIIDTQAVEQLFSSSKKDIYFLNNMAPGNNLFVTRLIYHLRNKERNKALLRKVKNQFGDKIVFTSFGQICQKYTPYENEFENTDNLQTTGPETEEEETVLEEIVFDWDIGGDNVGPMQSEVVTNVPDVDNALDSQNQVDIINRFSQLHEIFRDISLNEASLTESERRNLQRNIRYSYTVLYQKGDRHRRNEVKTIKTSLGAIQHQGFSNYCGLCCINNAIVCNADCVFDVDINEMDSTADLIWTDMALNPALSVTELIEPMRDREGYYSFEVLQRVLEKRNLNVLRIDHRNLLSIGAEDAARFICSQLQEIHMFVTLIIRLRLHQHWTTLKVVDGFFTLFDSKHKCPRQLSFRNAGEYILSNIVPPGAVFFLSPVNAEEYAIYLENTTPFINVDMEEKHISENATSEETTTSMKTSTGVHESLETSTTKTYTTNDHIHTEEDHTSEEEHNIYTEEDYASDDTIPYMNVSSENELQSEAINNAEDGHIKGICRNFKQTGTETQDEHPYNARQLNYHHTQVEATHKDEHNINTEEGPIYHDKHNIHTDDKAEFTDEGNTDIQLEDELSSKDVPNVQSEDEDANEYTKQYTHIDMQTEGQSEEVENIKEAISSNYMNTENIDESEKSASTCKQTNPSTNINKDRCHNTEEADTEKQQEHPYNLRLNPSRKRFSSNWLFQEGIADCTPKIIIHEDELPDLENDLPSGSEKEIIRPTPGHEYREWKKTKEERKLMKEQERKNKVRDECRNSMMEEKSVSQEHQLHDFVESLYDFINTHVLDSKLTAGKDTIYWADLSDRCKKPRNAQGLTFCSEEYRVLGGILLNCDFKNKTLAANVLLHELAHAVIAVNGIKDDCCHGPEYKKMARKITKETKKLLKKSEEMRDVVLDINEIIKAK